MSNENSRRSWPWYIWVAAGLLIILIITILLPSQNGSHSSPKLKSANNLKQLGLCIQLYANEHHGDFPDTFMTLLLTEDLTPPVFVSPGSNDTPATGSTPESTAANLTAGGHLSYTYLGRGLTDKATEDVVVAYENPNIWPTGANVLFADGHVEFMDSNYMRKLSDRSAAGIFPVTMPSIPSR